MSRDNSADTADASLIERVLFALATAGLIAYCLISFQANIWRVLQSSDTAWLARTGEYIVTNRRLPETDIFSWTADTQPWTAYQWLFEAICGFMFTYGGLWLVGLFAALAAAAVYFWLMPAQMIGQGVRPPYVFGLLSLTMNPVWFWARPQLVSFILIPVFLNILESYRLSRSVRRLLPLPPLMVLWANCHSFWFIGLLLVLAYTIPALAERQHARAPVIALACSCALAVLVNPYGWHLITYTLSFTTQPDFGTIWELQPGLLKDPSSNLGVIVYLSLAWLAILSSRKHVPVSLLLPAALSTAAAVMYYRFLPVAILITWPAIGLVLAGNSFTGQSVGQSGGPASARRRASLMAQAALAATAAATAIFAYTSHFSNREAVWFTHSNSNKGAVGFLKKNPALRKRMFADAAMGCSQILEGMTPVFIDTRFDFYGKPFCDAATACLKADGDWPAFLREYAIETVCVSSQYALYREMERAPGWAKVFGDGDYGIWKSEAAELRSPNRADKKPE